MCLEYNPPEEEYCQICFAELDDLTDVIDDEEQDDSIFSASYSVFRESNYEINSDVDTIQRGRALVAEDMVPIQWCLNCDSHERNCECRFEEALPISEVQEAVFDAEIDAYDPDGSCDTCVFMFSANCIPYREWLTSWIQDHESVDEQVLTGCENYRSNF